MNISCLNSWGPTFSSILLHKSAKQSCNIQNYHWNWVSVSVCFSSSQPVLFHDICDFAANTYLYIFLAWAMKSWKKLSNVASSVLVVSKWWRKEYKSNELHILSCSASSQYSIGCHFLGEKNFVDGMMNRWSGSGFHQYCFCVYVCHVLHRNAILCKKNNSFVLYLNQNLGIKVNKTPLKIITLSGGFINLWPRSWPISD